MADDDHILLICKICGFVRPKDGGHWRLPQSDEMDFIDGRIDVLCSRCG